MQRAIVGFHEDDQRDWVASLACGHGQHVRHKPPFQLREWVVTAQGRAARMGQSLDCLRCDRLELPETAVPYKRTPDFTNDTIPPGLLRDHTLKTGTWGRIVILEGRLGYTVTTDSVKPETFLDVDHPGIIPPEAAHQVRPLGPVRFFIEFLGYQA